MLKLNFNIRTKLTTTFLVFGLLPVGAVMPIVFNELHKMQQSHMDDMKNTAATIGNLIDRNLFERYGDVQAFGTNAASKSKQNWYTHTSDNPLIASMNAYMTNYGLYKIMMLVDMDGKVAAVNNVDNKGKELATSALYSKNFKDAGWFQKATRKEFSKGEGLDGTVVEQPRYESIVADSYKGEDGYAIPFAAPVYDYSGEMIGVWVNFADFGLVEGIIKDVYKQKTETGMKDIAFAIGDSKGTILVNYDPAARKEYENRQSSIIGKKTLEDMKIPAATTAIKEASGSTVELDTGSGEEDAVSWSKTSGALGFTGMGWTVVMHQPGEYAFADIVAARHLLLEVLAGALAVVFGIGALIGTMASKPLRKSTSNIQAIAGGDYTISVDDTGRTDEIGSLAKAMDELKGTLDTNTRVKQALDSVTSNVMMADEGNNIIYMNEAVINMLKEAEKDIQKDLPNFNVSKLIGANIDVFHKNPSHQKGMLEKMSKTLKTSIVVGGRSFNLVATPMFGQNGRRTGTVVEWQDGAAAGVYNAITKSQAVIEFDTQGNILTANENFLKVIGYSLDEIKGKHHSMFCESTYVSTPAYTQFWESLRRGEAQIAEFKRLGKGGKEIWINASYNPVLDLHGRTVRVVKTATDITDEMSKRREIALLSLVANETDNSVIITDANERIEYVNPGFTKMTGYTFEEVKGKKPGEVLQGKLTDAKTKQQIRESIKAQKPLYTEILNYHKNGESYWVSLAINPVFGKDGKIERFISIQSNVTATKERALDFSMQLDAISRSQAVISFNMDGTIIDCNKNFLDVTGYTLDEIKGKHHSMFVEPAHAASPEYRQFWDSLNRGQYVAGEFKRIGKGGKEVYIQASYNTVSDLAGKPVKVVKYASETTEAAITRIENEKGMKESVDILTGLSEGDLTRKMEQDYKGTFSQIKSSLNATIERLRDTVLRIKESAESVNSASSEISAGSTDLSQRTEEQASSLEETAASMEELTGTVRQNSENAKNANQLSAEAQDVAERGGQVVGEAVGAMNSIEKSSKKISDIISVIDEIAFQTNLLALNAAVEAARAGDAGKGFAVVASEVRSLAGRSATASKEIKALIMESSGQVKTGAELVNSAGTTLRDIVGSVKKVANIISEISNASTEQSTGIDEINTAISQMDEMTQQNAALVEENTAAAQSLVQQAQMLAQLVAFFKVDDKASEGAGRNSFEPVLVQSAKPTASARQRSNKPTRSPILADRKLIAASNGSGSHGGNGHDREWEEF